MITRERLLELERKEKVLLALDSAGVDNWEGYGIAMEEIFKEDEKEYLLYNSAEEILGEISDMIDEPAGSGAGYGFDTEATDVVIDIIKKAIINYNKIK